MIETACGGTGRVMARVVAVAAVLAAGCGSAVFEDDAAGDVGHEDAAHETPVDVPAEDAVPDGAEDVPADAEPDSSTDGGPSEIVEDVQPETTDGPDDGWTSCETHEFAAVADTFLVEGECNGANYQGGTPGLNLGMGPGLFRFVLSDAAADALLAGRVTEGSLQLQVMGSCPDGAACPFRPGRLEIRPLRDDWDEGRSPEFEAYTGADWCRRLGGNPGTPWAGAGATGGGDVDSVSGGLEIGVLPRSVSVPFAPAEHLRRFGATSRAISIRASFETGDGILVVYARESGNTLAPVLRLTVCE
jgi:hypothetical protein